MKIKRLFPTFTCFLFATATLYAQNRADCESSALFTALANHSMKDCETKEFEKLELLVTDKNKTRTAVEKAGSYVKMTYAYEGEFSTRPSALQIYTNYANAVTKAGGTILSNGERGLHATFKKGTDVYWITVYTDNSGWYWVETVKQSAMKQEVVLNAAEIKKAVQEDGKAVLYGIYFDTDKAEVKKESTPSLQAIADFLKNNPGIKIFVVGHTDNKGSWEHNLQLAKARAEAVVTALITVYKIEAARVQAQGVASLAPVNTNDTEEGRSKNRRVEIVKQ